MIAVILIFYYISNGPTSTIHVKLPPNFHKCLGEMKKMNRETLICLKNETVAEQIEKKTSSRIWWKRPELKLST